MNSRLKDWGNVLDLWMNYQTGRPNSSAVDEQSNHYNAIAKWTQEKQMVFRANRLIRVRSVKCLRSIRWVNAIANGVSRVNLTIACTRPNYRCRTAQLKKVQAVALVAP